MIDRTVNVPIPSEEINNTLQQLPRKPSNACIIPVQLKRMKNLKNAHRQEFIDCHKIIKAFSLLYPVTLSAKYITYLTSQV